MKFSFLNICIVSLYEKTIGIMLKVSFNIIAQFIRNTFTQNQQSSKGLYFRTMSGRKSFRGIFGNFGEILLSFEVHSTKQNPRYHQEFRHKSFIDWAIEEVQAVQYPVELLYTLELPHQTKWQSQYMLLRNLEAPRLCSGTKLTNSR